jgi:hypothetical protein
MAENKKPHPGDGYSLKPTAKFVELMWQCEDDDWTWDQFLKAVKKHFGKLPHNKDKEFNEASVRSKAKAVNKKIVEKGGDLIDMPFKQTNKVDWALMINRRKKQKAEKQKAEKQSD